MEITSFSFDQNHISGLYSHPKSNLNPNPKPLEVHLIKSAILASSFAEEKNIALCPKNTLIQISKITALLHDIGKATLFFQKHLFGENQSHLSRHSLLSAVCVYGVLEYLILQRAIDEPRIFKDHLPLICFLAVLKHHSDLDDIKQMIIITDEDKTFLLKQIESIESSKFEILIENICKYCNDLSFLTVDKMKEFVESVPNSIKMHKRRFRTFNDENMNYFFMINLLYSIILDADKTEAVFGTSVDLPKFSLSHYDVDNFRKQRFKSDNFDNLIKTLRDSAFEEAMTTPINPDDRIYALCLPTGLGKTMVSFAFSLRLKQVAENSFGSRFRIIYSLPFLSIIEQNYFVLSDILRWCNIEPTSDIILKHHHLSEVVYETNHMSSKKDQPDQEKIETDIAKLLIEGWNSNIVVTTFVQFFESIMTNKNSNMRKFHRIANSIIILDEAQAINSEHWFLCKNVLDALCKALNCYIIFSTATMPFMLDRKTSINIVKSEKYFDKLCRTKLYYDENFIRIGLEEFAAKIEIDYKKTYLFIMNTVESTKKLYNLLKDRFSDFNDKITILTTQIIPKERLKRIDLIKKKTFKIVVSTQLVEAGVDVDFDCVIRDIAPLDSIIQSAGRANREGKKGIGEVKIVELISENSKLLASQIYDNILIEVTKKILHEKSPTEESRFSELVDEYYNELVKRGVIETSKDDLGLSYKFLEAVYGLRYYSSDEQDKGIGDFSLIDDKTFKVDVFIEADEFAKYIWEEFKKIRQIKHLFERRKSFLKIRKDFYDYVISVPKSDNIPPIVENMLYVSNAQLSDFYDVVTGYKTKGSTYMSF